MAKLEAEDLLSTLRARGLRKRVARDVADAIGSGPRKNPAPIVEQVVGDLRSLADLIEDRATGESAKRRAAARKAAATRQQKAQARSTAARKAARTRAQGS